MTRSKIIGRFVLISSVFLASPTLAQQEALQDAEAAPTEKPELTDEERAWMARWEAEAQAEARIAIAEAAVATAELERVKAETAKAEAELARANERLEAERAETAQIEKELRDAQQIRDALERVLGSTETETPEN